MPNAPEVCIHHDEKQEDPYLPMGVEAECTLHFFAITLYNNTSKVKTDSSMDFDVTLLFYGLYRGMMHSNFAELENRK